MHNGLFDIDGIVNMYSNGMATLRPTAAQAADPLSPKKSPLLQNLDMAQAEKRQVLAFLAELEERPRRVRAPELPALDDR